MEQADDFLEESRALFALLADRPDSDFDKVTLFKDWSVNDVLRHHCASHGDVGARAGSL